MKLKEYKTVLSNNAVPLLAELKSLYDVDGRRHYVSSPEDVATIAHEIIGADAEEKALAFFLNTAGSIVGFSVIGQGTINSSFFDVRGLFQKAFLMGAARVILAHNHPSGSTSASQEDIAVTEKAIKAGRLLDIPVLDHIITTPGGNYLSFRESGLMEGM